MARAILMKSEMTIPWQPMYIQPPVVILPQKTMDISINDRLKEQNAIQVSGTGQDGLFTNGNRVTVINYQFGYISN